MKRAPIIVIAVLLLAVAVFVRLQPHRESDAAASSTIGTSQPASDRPTAAQPRDAIVTTQETVTKRLQSVVAETGATSAQAKAIYHNAIAICDGMVLNPPDDSGLATDRAWAQAKLETECAEFRSDDWSSIGDSSAGTFAVAKAQGEEAATSKAMHDLGEVIDSTALVEAGLFLIEHDKLPAQASYGLTKEQMARAFGLAAGLRTCGAMRACGPDSLWTASTCAQVGCPPGVSFVDAAKRSLTPREFEVAMRIRDSLAQR